MSQNPLTMNKKVLILQKKKKRLNFKLKHRKAQKSLFAWEIWVTCTGGRETSAVSGRLPDNLGGLAYMRSRCKIANLYTQCPDSELQKPFSFQENISI